MTAQEKLIAIYEQAEKRLFAIIQKKGAFASAAMYERSLLQQVQKELNRLKANSAKTVDELVIENYQSSLNELIEDLKKIGAPIDTDITPAQLAMSKLNTRQIELIARNATGDFNKAINIIGRRTQDMIRTVTLEATAQKLSTGQTVRQMQKSLTEIFKAQNVFSVPYKNGASMPIKKYAEMTARSTTAETQNKAQTTQGIDWGYDLVRMTDHSPTCPICAMYQGRVYAITKEAANGKYKAPDGTPLMFPYLYDTAFVKGYETIHPNCRHRISIFPARVYTKEKLREFSQKSTAPFEDTRTDAERKAYAEMQAEKRRRNENYKQYERIKVVLPNDAPKSFAGFVRMKQANSEKYQELMSDYRYIMRVAKFQNDDIMETKNSNSKLGKLKEKIKGLVTPEKYKPVSEEYLLSLPKLQKPDNIERALEFTNPNRYTENCQRCVFTYEMRRRGYDVIAKDAPKNPLDDNIGLGDYRKVCINAQWKKCDGSGFEEISDYLHNCKSNARVVIGIQMEEFAHLFFAEKLNDEIYFIDPQSNKLDARNRFDRAIEGFTEFARIDNLEFSNLIKDCVGVNINVDNSKASL